MPPFGDTLYVWRAARGVTQQALARASGLPRPALSALERGTLDPTLRTIRRVAGGLGIPPGWLVDGRLPPGPSAWRSTRTSVERVVAALAGRPARLTPLEQRVVTLVRPVVRPRLAMLAGRAPGRGGVRRSRAAWVLAQGHLGDVALRTLVARLDKEAQRRP